MGQGSSIPLLTALCIGAEMSLPPSETMLCDLLCRAYGFITLPCSPSLSVGGRAAWQAGGQGGMYWEGRGHTLPALFVLSLSLTPWFTLLFLAHLFKVCVTHLCVHGCDSLALYVRGGFYMRRGDCALPCACVCAHIYLHSTHSGQRCRECNILLILWCFLKLSLLWAVTLTSCWGLCILQWNNLLHPHWKAPPWRPPTVYSH